MRPRSLVTIAFLSTALTACTVDVEALQAKLVDTCRVGFVTPAIDGCDNADDLADLAFSWRIQREVTDDGVEACLLERDCEDLNDCFPRPAGDSACYTACNNAMLDCGADCTESGLAACLVDDDRCRDECDRP